MIQVRIGNEIAAVDHYKWSSTSPKLTAKLQAICQEPDPAHGDIDYSAARQVRAIYPDLVVLSADPPESKPGVVY
jgi:hypothetical protein